jgi:hypothetical protein
VYQRSGRSVFAKGARANHVMALTVAVRFPLTRNVEGGRKMSQNVV